MKHGTPAQKMWILHLLESVLNVVLRAVGQHDFFVGPICVIGKQDGFAPLDSGQSFQRHRVGGEGQL